MLAARRQPKNGREKEIAMFLEIIYKDYYSHPCLPSTSPQVLATGKIQRIAGVMRLFQLNCIYIYIYMVCTLAKFP